MNWAKPNKTHDEKPTAVLLGVTADIGRHIAGFLLRDGWRVIGLGRHAERATNLIGKDSFHFIPCDLTVTQSIKNAIREVCALGWHWNLFASIAGTMEPIGRFFDLDFDEWEQSVVVNSTAQLRVLHGLWPQRDNTRAIDVMLLAGGGTNNAMTNYSAYCLSKIALIKMCELIDDEEPQANAFIIGPGFVPTRIHEETLRAGPAAGEGFEKTKAFLETNGTSFEDIYKHMHWCMSEGRRVAGGRNFSTVHDPWRNNAMALSSSLVGDPNAFRLRRHKSGLTP